MSSTLIAVAPNGARKTKRDHPKIPLTPTEIGETAKSCLEAGASMIHVHVRDKQFKHSLSVELYKEAIKQIRLKTDDAMLIQVTSESVDCYSPEEQFEMIYELKPPAVSIGLREIKSLDETQINKHFKHMRNNQVSPQLILYNAYDIAVYKDWLQRGVLPGSAYPVLLVIGKPQKEGVFECKNLQASLFKELPLTSWMTCGFGCQELQVSTQSVNLGGHVRIGFENNDLLKNKEIAGNNSELVAQIATVIREKGFSMMDAVAAQKLVKPDW